ncbi:right-handed parallel beta-helix repeat-containing protein [Alcanivorax sp. JB21]|uniref:parallel beta-helix domain-containing protein n=1 Tax=Alcanivorax limicola TaxID=2874102 RepID=UPI001CBFAE1B|nr:parallel beta-helix domain-containing protein [Alcanivorax limicola]MBZ2187689.1 right-handed parallel beta-helix repeat-containing protein [Alcanivorax limicola]
MTDFHHPAPWQRFAAVALLSASASLVACGGSSSSSSGPSFPPGAIMLDANDLTESAKTAFITASPGDVIVFPEGHFMIEDTLTLDGVTSGLHNVTLRGYGRERTTLDFSGSVGGDGIYVQNASDITIRDLTVIEANNNAIKLLGVDGIHIHHAGAEWRGDLTSDNGAYGLYPVESSNILIEHSYVRGSADAGIYVGQSQNIVVRHNIAEENVAGIEIENSSNADVYGNIARHNTGGILIFDLPIGNGIYGSTVRVFDNDIQSNNTDNFANESANPAGVHIVPPGTGVIVLSTRDVEIYHNRIDDHDTTAVAITDYQIAGTPSADVITDGFRPTPRNIHIHDNEIGESGGDPRGLLIETIVAPVFAMIGEGVPAILYDGLGEVLANQGFSAGLGEEAFAADGSDNVCATDNGDISVGYLFDPADESALQFNEGEPVPRPAVDTGNGSSIFCTQPRLPASAATINGVSYGCGEDDDGAACQL